MKYSTAAIIFIGNRYMFQKRDNKKEIFIARDRFGEKPFYYSILQENGHTHFYFASEMKALWSAGISKEIHHQQILNYLTL